MSEEEISIEALRQGDSDAYQKLISLYEKPLTNLVIRFISNYDDAKEIVQDVFLTFYKNIDKFEGRSKIYTWLYRVASNKSIDVIRKKARERKYMTKVYDASTQQEVFSENTLNVMVLTEALSKLEEDFRTPLLLAEYENYSYEEIANKLDIPINTVRTRIFRARKKLLSIVNKMRVTL